MLIRDTPAYSQTIAELIKTEWDLATSAVQKQTILQKIEKSESLDTVPLVIDAIHDADCYGTIMSTIAESNYSNLLPKHPNSISAFYDATWQAIESYASDPEKVLMGLQALTQARSIHLTSALTSIEDRKVIRSQTHIGQQIFGRYLVIINNDDVAIEAKMQAVNALGKVKKKLRNDLSENEQQQLIDTLKTRFVSTSDETLKIAANEQLTSLGFAPETWGVECHICHDDKPYEPMDACDYCEKITHHEHLNLHKVQTQRYSKWFCSETCKANYLKEHPITTNDMR